MQFFEELTSKSTCSKGTQKLLSGVSLQRSLVGSCSLLVIGTMSIFFKSTFLKSRINTMPWTNHEIPWLICPFGWRGIARHCNYLGDLLLALSFSLPCGIRWRNINPPSVLFIWTKFQVWSPILRIVLICSSPVPYFYPIYLLILLVWRERRDEARCAEKYREIWAEYRKLVPWRILPYIY